MRPTGAMHLGHYHGALKNWVRLQHEHDCFFFVADWHALTTHYEEREVIEKTVYDMVVDWLAAGLDPDKAHDLHPEPPARARRAVHAAGHGHAAGLAGTRADLQGPDREAASDRDLATYGFLGYPLLQAADILIYKATYVPVGEDQASHVELTREVARRFNHLYGRAAELRGRRGRRAGQARQGRRALLRASSARPSARPARAEALAKGEGDRAQGGRGRRRLDRRRHRTAARPPAAAAARASWSSRRRCTPRSPRLPGLDGAKMSKSYGNADPDARRAGDGRRRRSAA